MAASALVAFLTTATNPIAVIFAPLLAFRALAVRRPREHAVTVGYLAGWIPQVLVIASAYGRHSQRVGQLATPGQSVSYYFHWVPLRVLGWHLSWWLSQVAGWNSATFVIGGVTLAVLGWTMTQGRQVRAFVVLAVVLGFAETILSATITPVVTVSAPNPSWEAASRYSLLPIIALTAAAIVGVDALVARGGGVRAALTARRAGPVAAVAALALVLACSWGPDLRYTTERVGYGHWGPKATRWLDECRHQSAITVFAWQSPHNEGTIPCANLVP